MGNFNLNDYETVKSRKKRFYEDHKDGRIVVYNRTPENMYLEFSLFEAQVFKDKNNSVFDANGWAMEIRDKELKKGKAGMYESVNFSSWTENCEESAIGRALDNAGYSGNLKCSREEMEKAQRMSNIKPTKETVTKEFKMTKEQSEILESLMKEANKTEEGKTAIRALIRGEKSYKSVIVQLQNSLK